MRIVHTHEKIVQELKKSDLYNEMQSLGACDFLVIEEKDGKIIGAGGVGGLFNVPSLQIAEGFQGKGLGKILLGATIDEAKRRGYSFISGSRNPENFRAIKLHDFYGFYPVFRIHYSQGIVRDVIILVLRPRGKIVAGFLSIFNNIVGTAILACILKFTKPLFKNVLTLSPEEFPNPSITYMIKNFEKLRRNIQNNEHNQDKGELYNEHNKW